MLEGNIRFLHIDDYKEIHCIDGMAISKTSYCNSDCFSYLTIKYSTLKQTTDIKMQESTQVIFMIILISHVIRYYLYDNIDIAYN